MLRSCTEKLKPAQVKIGARERKRERKPGMCSVIQAKAENVTPKKGQVQE